MARSLAPLSALARATTPDTLPNLPCAHRVSQTIGFNVENVEYRNLHMSIWDVGGQDRIRTLCARAAIHTRGRGSRDPAPARVSPR
jgi:GTPase SAR1 family protein